MPEKRLGETLISPPPIQPLQCAYAENLRVVSPLRADFEIRARRLRKSLEKREIPKCRSQIIVDSFDFLNDEIGLLHFSKGRNSFLRSEILTSPSRGRQIITSSPIRKSDLWLCFEVRIPVALSSQFSSLFLGDFRNATSSSKIHGTRIFPGFFAFARFVRRRR